MIITQNSRISHHTTTTPGTTFSVPTQEDFTISGTNSWTVNDLCLSEIGINEADNKAYIRIGDNINEFSFGGGSGVSGTVNYISKFDTPTSISNSQIYDDGTYVGIGTTSSSYKLTVNGTASINAFNMTSGASNSYVLTSDSTGNGTWVKIPGNGATVSGTTNYLSKFTSTNVLGDSLIYDNGTNVGIGTTSPSYFVTIEKNVNDFPYHLVIANNSAGTSAASSLRINTDVNGFEFGVLNSGNTIYSTYGSANDAFLRYNPSVSYQGNVNFLLSPNASTTKAFRFFVSQNAGSNYRLSIDKDGVLVKGSTSDSTAYALKVDNSSSSALLYVRNDGAFWVNTNAGDGKFHFQDGDFRIYDGSNKRMTLLQNGRLTFGASTIDSRFHFYDPNATATESAIMVETNYSTTSYSARYTAFKGLNISMAVGDVFRVLGASDNSSYDLGAMFLEKTASGEGSWHFTTRVGTALTLGLKVVKDNVIVGQNAAVATTATDGFLYVPSCAGTPTGVPTAYTGKIAVVADSTNNKLYIYSGGAWVALN